MAAKRYVPNNEENLPKSPPNLKIPREEANNQLLSRIDLGKAIGNLSIKTEANYNNIRQEFKKWHDFNIELLRRMFDSEELSKEYGYLSTSISVESLDSRIKYFLEDLNDYIGRLESIKERLSLYPVLANLPLNAITLNIGQRVPATKDIFVVHGTNHGVKETVARLLTKLKLNPIILHEQPNMANTIIEKLEKNSYVSFCVVLLTPDDKGGAIGGEEKNRARQNVIFELGYFMAKLGRKNVCALYSDNVELPSDFQGILYVPLDPGGSWQFTLAKELKAAGLEVDLNLLI
jgi:predicted nucleotide-binding protein